MAKARRRELDFYPTAAWATKVLLAHADVRGVVREPCHGAGDITKVLLASPKIVAVETNDVDRARVADTHADATDRTWWKTLGPATWTVTNPPFVDAPAIVPLARAFTAKMAMLLRLTYLEPCEGRAGWLAQCPPDHLIVLPRISFTGDGKTDSVTCGWMIWDPDMPKGITVVPDPRTLPGTLLDTLAG
jgi:hypothetical protein